MEKARTIPELANVLIPSEPLNRYNDRDEYVPIYDDILSVLRDRILNDAPRNRTYLISGQSGTGKTTALNFLAAPEIEEKFELKYLYGRDLLDPIDTDIIDVLLMLAFKLVKGTSLENKYYKKLENLQKSHEGTLEEESERASGRKGEAGGEGKAGSGITFLNFLKLRADFFSNYKIESSYRRQAREIFKVKKPKLLKLVNDLIDEYHAEVSQGKQILFIIDDLDKLRQIDQIKDLFINQRYYYLNIQCKKIIAIPVHLTTEPEISNLGLDIPQFGCTLKPNPIEPDAANHDALEKNKNNLRKVITQRIADDHLVEDDAVEESIEYSGGILRQFMEILYNAATKARHLQSPTITRELVKDARNSIKSTLDRTVVSSEKIDLLNTIRLNHTPTSIDNEQFVICLLNNQIIACSNGTIWYEVNPIIEKTVEIYASRNQ